VLWLGPSLKISSLGPECLLLLGGRASCRALVELRAELNAELRAELNVELRAELRAELCAELRAEP
jgi:hypothetical protein